MIVDIEDNDIFHFERSFYFFIIDNQDIYNVKEKIKS